MHMAAATHITVEKNLVVFVFLVGKKSSVFSPCSSSVFETKVTRTVLTKKNQSIIVFSCMQL